MPLPRPPVALDDICSVIYNNTLYTYSQNAFQALPLTPGGNWTELPQGEKVTGGVCVGSTPADARSAGFYVVGGNATNPDYQGLQRFTYSTGKWETITPQAPVTQQRLWHGAVYLAASDTILIYAGAQDGAQNPSSQTFTVGTSPPYAVISYESVAPPTINPILLQWSDSEAVLVGGSTTNKQVTLFKPETSWVDSGASLAEPLEKDITAIKAVVVTGDDGCKNLYTFDMTQSPNAVTRTVLVNGQGQPVQNSPRILTRSDTKEDSHTLTLGDWPQYNSTLAPTATRTNYALAQDPDALIVIAGGNQDDILCMFDGRENGWQNATARLTVQKVSAQDTTSTTSTATLETASATHTSTSATAVAPESITATPTPAAGTTDGQGHSSKLGTNALLGIILGSVFGVAVILSLIYICIKRRRLHQAYLEAGHIRRASGVSSAEKDSIVFANDSLPHGLSGAGVFRGHQPQDSANSFSSMAILMGKVNQQNHQHPPGLKRNASGQTKRSSSSSLFNKAFKSTISKPIPQMAETMFTEPPSRPPPQSRDEKGVAFTPSTTGPRPRASNAVGGTDRRDSTRRSSGWNRYWSGGSALNILGFGNGNAAAATAKRMTTESDKSSQYSNVSHHRITQDSATVPPLNVYEPRASFSQVTRGSPTVSHFGSEIKAEMKGQIERPASAVSDLSGYSSGIPASVHEAWDPSQVQKPWGSDRAPSSAYSSVYATSLAPAAPASRQYQPPSGVSRQPQLATAATSSDMSWLNLGDNNH